MVILAIDFHSRDDKDQLSDTHFRHSNGNHNGYVQFEAKFMIFGIFKFLKVSAYNEQVRWYIKPSFDGIFPQQYLLESNNYC